MLWGIVGSIFAIISVFVTVYLKFSHTFELCDSRRFLTIKRFGNKSEKMVTIGRSMDSIAVIVNTYVDFSYMTVVYVFICVISILDNLQWSLFIFSASYFICNILAIMYASQWIQKTNPNFRRNGIEFKASLIVSCIAFICMTYTKVVGVIVLLAFLCVVLYCIPIFYYADLLNGQDAKVKFYISFGFYDKVEENPFIIVLSDGTVLDNREKRFYPLFEEDGNMLLYKEKKKKPRMVERKDIVKILYKGEEIEV